MQCMKCKSVLLFMVILPSFLYAIDAGEQHKIDSMINYDHLVLMQKVCTISGGILLGGSLGLAAVLSPILASSPYETDHRVAKVLWIPIVGPIAADAVDGIDSPIITLMCVGWSATELVGAILLTSGILRKKALDKNKKTISVHPALIQGRCIGIELSMDL